MLNENCNLPSPTTSLILCLAHAWSLCFLSPVSPGPDQSKNMSGGGCNILRLCCKKEDGSFEAVGKDLSFREMTGPCNTCSLISMGEAVPNTFNVPPTCHQGGLA